ncbi:hypothetical protein Tco_1465897 [Tanacetum coccineum]
MGKSTETLRLLTNKQKAFRDNLWKSGLGYNGPYILSQAYAKIPKLYRAYELCNKNEQLHALDSEETLEDAKKKLSAEQTYFPSSFISSEKVSSETKPSMASMPSANPMLVDLNEMENVFKKLFELLEKNCKRESIFYTSKEELRLIDVCVEAKLILREWHVYFELLKDQLLEASLAEDIKNLVITSCVEIRNKDLHDETERISKESKDVSNESTTADTVCNDAFEVTQELSKRIIELEKDLSKFKAKSIAFEIALQHKSRVESNECVKSKLRKKWQHWEKLNAFDKENCDFESKVIHLKKIIAQKSKDFDDVNLELSNRTAKFEAYFEKLEKIECYSEHNLARKVDDSKAEKDQILKEINHLRTQLENLKGKRVETKFDNSSILGKPPLLRKMKVIKLLNKLHLWNQNWHHMIFVIVKK